MADNLVITKELRNIASGGTVFFFGNLIGLGVNLVYNWLIARMLGAEGIGIISLVLSTITILTSVSLFGLRRSLVRFIATHQSRSEYGKINGLILTSIVFVWVLSTGFTLALFFNRSLIVNQLFNDPNLLEPFSIIIFCLPFSTMTTILAFVAQAFKRADYQTAIVNIIAPVSRLAVTGIMFFVLDTSTVTAAYGIISAYIISAIFAVFSLHRIYSFSHFLTYRPARILPQLLESSWPLLFMELINEALGPMGIVFIGILATSSAVGIYKVSIRLTVFIRLFYKALSTMFGPVIADAYANDDRNLLDTSIKTVTRWGFLTGFLVFLVLVLFSGEILAFFGPDFIAGIPAMQIMAVSHIIIVLSGPMGLLLTMIGYPLLNLMNSIVIGGVTIWMQFLLIPKYGSTGAALAIAIGTIAVVAIQIVEVRAILKIYPVDRTILKPMLAGLMATIGILGLNQLLNVDYQSLWMLLTGVLVIVSIYLGVLFMLGFEENDRDLVRYFYERFRKILTFSSS